MTERYITIEQSMIVMGQSSSGSWYCKEFSIPFSKRKQIKKIMAETNKALNFVNHKEKNDAEKIKSPYIKKKDRVDKGDK